MASDPFSRQAVKLSGAERIYRVSRVGNYRSVYEIDRGAEQITICYIRHRRDVYRAL